MPNLAIIARIEVAPGRVNEFVSLLTAHRGRSLSDEPGTLTFDILRARDDDSLVVVYEVYRDDAAFEAHRTGASITRFRKESDGMIAKVTSTHCTPVEAKRDGV